MLVFYILNFAQKLPTVAPYFSFTNSSNYSMAIFSTEQHEIRTLWMGTIDSLFTHKKDTCNFHVYKYAALSDIQMCLHSSHMKGG